MWLGRAVSPRNVPVFSTGSFALDLALGVGGIPKVFVSGKTTLALHVIAEAQKEGGTCVFVDAEHALDSSLAKAIGVNTENLLLSQPDCGEQALSLVDTLIRSGSVDVIVVDSVSKVAMQARLMIQALRKVSSGLDFGELVAAHETSMELVEAGSASATAANVPMASPRTQRTISIESPRLPPTPKSPKIHRTTSMEYSPRILRTTSMDSPRLGELNDESIKSFLSSNIPEDGSRLIKEVDDLDDEAFDDDIVYVRDDCEGLLVVD